MEILTSYYLIDQSQHAKSVSHIILVITVLSNDNDDSVSVNWCFLLLEMQLRNQSWHSPPSPLPFLAFVNCSIFPILGVDTRVTFAPPTAEEVARPVSRPNTSSSGSFCRRFRGTKREQLSRSSREDQIDILVSSRVRRAAALCDCCNCTFSNNQGPVARKRH